LATSLYLWDNPRMKVSTLMFATAPSIFQDNRVDREWAIPSNSPDSKYKLILDAHFIGMTPLNDVKLLSHRFECVLGFR
jgi:hypothetical protein